MKVIVLQGVSGSGKSTYAEKLTAGLEEVRTRIVSADDFFVEYGGGRYKFDASKLDKAHGACFRGFLSVLMQGVPLVVVDNTCTTVIEVAPYMLAASAFGYEAEIHRISCEPAVAAARNTKGISAETVARQQEALKRFEAPPWWKLIEIEQ